MCKELLKGMNPSKMRISDGCYYTINKLQIVQDFFLSFRKKFHIICTDENVFFPARVHYSWAYEAGN